MESLSVSTPHHNTTIYLLLDPRSAEVRYVGMTTVSKEQRLRKHYGESRVKHRTRKERWIVALLNLGLEPVILAIEEIPWSERSERERYWIRHYRQAGCELFNGNDGGLGALGTKHSDEAKRKISLANTGHQWTPEQRARMSVIKKGQTHSPETRRRMSEGRLEMLRRRPEIIARGDRSRARKYPGSTAGELNGRARLNETDVRSIRERHANRTRTYFQLAHEYGVNHSTIMRCVKGETWKNLK